MTKKRTLYKNAYVYRTDLKSFGVYDLAVCGDKIDEIAERITPEQADTCVDLKGYTVLPGLVDVHVHFREPGAPEKETIRTGTLAAAHGGYTTVCTMPNLNPAPDSEETLAIQERLIQEQAVIEVLPYATITKGQKGAGELVDFPVLAKRVVGFSDDGCGVQSDELMEEAMRRCAKLDKPVVAHCEVDELVRGGYIHDGLYCQQNGHKGICSQSEWEQVKRDVELSGKTGCQYHICHVSTKESVAFLAEAKRKGYRCSGETAPHYLLLTDMDLQDEGRFKMNPPIRAAEDQAALREAILDGTIEVIATDHAPHTKEQKAKGLAGSNMGIVGLEVAFPLLYTYFVRSGKMKLEQLVALMADNPRRLFRIQGGTAVGDRADFCVMDLEASYKIDPETFLSKGRATPFAGYEVYGQTILTVAGGRTVYERE